MRGARLVSVSRATPSEQRMLPPVVRAASGGDHTVPEDHMQR